MVGGELLRPCQIGGGVGALLPRLVVFRTSFASRIIAVRSKPFEGVGSKDVVLEGCGETRGREKGCLTSKTRKWNEGVGSSCG